MKEGIRQIVETQSTTATVRGAILPLAQGGHIAFDEYGDRRGVPVIFFHGWPSSRSMAELTEAAAWECGVRIISPDRPGIRDSSFQAGRRLQDWPEIMRALTAHLSLERFHLLALSGGAPYAYATALAMPEQVRALAIVSGAPPLAELKDYSGLLPTHRRLLTLYFRWPQALRALVHVARPILLLRPPLRLRPLLLRFLQPCDAAVLRERAAFEACFESAAARVDRFGARGDYGGGDLRATVGLRAGSNHAPCADVARDEGPDICRAFSGGHGGAVADLSAKSGGGCGTLLAPHPADAGNPARFGFDVSDTFSVRPDARRGN